MEAEEDWNIIGIKNRQAMVRDRRKWRKIVLEAKVHGGLQGFRRRRTRRRRRRRNIKCRRVV
jgi:hypothetical protein